MGCTREELGVRMSSRELTTRMLAEKHDPLLEMFARLIAELRNTVSTEKVWQPTDIIDLPRPEEDDELDDYEPQTAEQLRAAFAWAGVVVSDGDNH